MSELGQVETFAGDVCHVRSWGKTGRSLSGSVRTVHSHNQSYWICFAATSRPRAAPAHQFKRVNPMMRPQAISMVVGLKNGSFFPTWQSLLHASTPRRSKAPVKGGLWLSAASARLILLPGLPRPGSLACAASKTGWRGPSRRKSQKLRRSRPRSRLAALLHSCSNTCPGSGRGFR